jgi:hypothetical protein
VDEPLSLHRLSTYVLALGLIEVLDFIPAYWIPLEYYDLRWAWLIAQNYPLRCGCYAPCDLHRIWHVLEQVWENA